MKENEPAKSNARLVVAMLLTGKPFKSKEMADAIADAEKRDVNSGTVSSILSRISDEQKCSFGCFIRKTRDGNALVYRLVSEALALSENQAYGLTLKKGKERYPIEQAVSEFPVLQKYLPAPFGDSAGPERKPFFRIVKSAAETVASAPLFRVDSPSRSSSNKDRRIDVTIRYSSSCSLSFSATLATFMMVCCALVLSVAACCLVAYMFFYPLLVMVLAIAAIGGVGLFFWKNRGV